MEITTISFRFIKFIKLRGLKERSAVVDENQNFGMVIQDNLETFQKTSYGFEVMLYTKCIIQKFTAKGIPELRQLQGVCISFA